MRTLCWSLILLAACEPITASESLEGLIEARRELPLAEGTAPAPLTEVLPSASNSFDFDADAPSDEPAAEPLNDAELLAGLGLDTGAPQVAEVTEVTEDPLTEAPPSEVSPEPVEPEPTVEVVSANPTPTQGAWTPNQPVSLGFGVRLLSTVTRAQPPRAILGLADGSEVVVEPGTMVPSARIIVLAIGDDAVQIAEVTPMGDRARLDSKILSALYRAAPQPAPGR